MLFSGLLFIEKVSKKSVTIGRRLWGRGGFLSVIVKQYLKTRVFLKYQKFGIKITFVGYKKVNKNQLI